MTDPRRLKDEYAGDLRGQLLRSVAKDAPRRNAHQRTLVALGFGGAALGIPTATTAAAATKVSTAMTVALIAKWVAVGIGAAVVTVGAVYEGPQLVHHRASSVAAPIEKAPVVTTVGTEVRAPAAFFASGAESAPTENVPTIENQVSVTGASSAERTPTRSPRAVPAVGKDTSAAPPPSPPRADVPEARGLSDEVAMLDAARRMVSTNPVGTLRALDDYQRQFPHGDLAPEALVLRIDALVHSGQQATADKLASEYLARNPGSPHARKIRGLLGGSAVPSQ